MIWYTIPGLSMSKVYSNSMLALLNNRVTIVGGRNTRETFEAFEMQSGSLRTRYREAETSMVATSEAFNSQDGSREMVS